MKLRGLITNSAGVSFASFTTLGAQPPPPQAPPQQATSQPPHTPARKPEDDAARLAAILESRRKLAELERDPLARDLLAVLNERA